MSGTSTPVSGRSTPALSSKRKIGASTSSQSQSRSEAVLEKALDALEKAQDDAQIFGDFIASSIRELDTVDKQQALKRALNRALLDFQDAQSQASYQAPYQQPYQAQQYQSTSYASAPNPTSASSNLSLPSFASINPADTQNPFGSHTYQNL